MFVLPIYNTKLYMLADDDTAERLRGKKLYYCKRDGYIQIQYEAKTVYMHRLIMGFPKCQVDHINGDKLDNRRCNLRLATRSENQANKRKRAGTTSQFKGVYWHKQKQKWQARIMKDYKRLHLGYFSDEIEAARAYNKAAEDLFGPFAVLNEIDE